MAATEVYTQIRQFISRHVDAQVDQSTRERLALVVTGMIQAQNGAPAQIAAGLDELALGLGTAPSLERRIRRFENDAEVSAVLCVHPLARERLCLGHPQELLLVLDPTTQEDHVVLVTVAVWYRGRALPLAWALWPANEPLVGARFWARIAAVLDTVAALLPVGVPVTWLADRAFGSPAFTDLLTARGWHYVVRVQKQTRYYTQDGREAAVHTLVSRQRPRRKLRGWVFKKRGWRVASVVAFWGRRHKHPLYLVSDLPPRWRLVRLYRRRYGIEALFRDYKSFGWQWEYGQVTDLAHIERLLVAMAIATWVTLYVGTMVATELLQTPPTGRRRTLPWEGKRSLFTLGLQRVHRWCHTRATPPICWEWRDWDLLNWSEQLYFHHARAFVFASP